MIARVVIAVAILLATSTAHAQMLSPGPLSKAHASLDTDDGCSNCHDSGKGVSKSKCLSCHKDLAAELAADRGLHGKQYKGQSCESCHVEHISRSTKLIRWPGGSADKLDHDLTGYKLAGPHTKPRCTQCHKKTSALGATQYLGTSTTCASCHSDPHQKRFGTTCDKCHAVSSWGAFDRSKFDHGLATFPLTGKHTQVTCEKCHGTPPKWKPLASKGCDSCHADPHDKQFAPKACTDCHDTSGWDAAAEKLRTSHPGLSLAAGHAKVACTKCHDRGNTKPPSKGSACASCHAPVHLAELGKKCETCHASIRWLGLSDAIGRKTHAKTRYPLEGQHAQQACAKCHPKSTPVAKRYRNLAFATCVDCHADVHAGELTEHGGGECSGCHTVDGFAPTTFGVAQHASTALPLAGKHEAVACTSCHPRGTKAGPRSFTNAKRACAECHANPHGSQFAAEMQTQGCAACHDVADWKRPKIAHDTWPLTGDHARAPCARCHGEQTTGAEPAAYRGIARDCAGCHDDVHAGQFRHSAPEKTCETCHSTTAFKSTSTAPGAAFDHVTTGFALGGKHAQATCDACHRPTELRNGATAIRYRLGYQACEDCHASPHGTAIGDLGCASCHSDAGWRVGASATPGGGFDHARTGFPLRGAHAQRACASCHQGAGKPASTCEGCHTDAHQGRNTGTCAECHTSTAWSDTAALERHRRTRMPLTGAHATVDCAGCHQRQSGERTYSDVPRDCIGCHEDDYRRDDVHPIHDGAGGNAPLPRDCGQCHRTIAWSPAVVTTNAVLRQAATVDHDTQFVLSRGSHRTATCDSCHPDAARPRSVRCDGCHTQTTLDSQHTRPVAARASCLRCHPRGAAR